MGIYTIKHLATILDARADRLLDIAASKKLLYATFLQERRGKTREINRPLKPLRDIQRAVYRKLLREYVFQDCVHGGVPGRSIFTAVSSHVGREVVVTCDLRDFYPSISQSDVKDVFLRELRCGRKVARLLADLTTFDGHLPQGAPTSMALANLVMAPADLEIALKLSALGPGVRYTRWVDDLIVSGPLTNPRVVFDIVAEAVRPLGLRVHRKPAKRLIMPRSKYQHALGVGLNERLSIPKHYRSNLRAAVYTLVRSRRGSMPNIVGRLQFISTCHVQLAQRTLASLRLTIESAVRRRRCT